MATKASTHSESQSDGAPATPAGSRSFAVSLTALILAISAMGFASVPALAFNQPLPNPFAQEPKPQIPDKSAPEREGGLTLKFKSISVNIGGKAKEQEPEESPPDPPKQLALTDDPIRWFTVATIGLGLLGIVAALVGHVRERHFPLTAGSLGLCAAAITWQYFAIGIAVGAAVAACLIVLAILGSIFN